MGQQRPGVKLHDWQTQEERRRIHQSRVWIVRQWALAKRLHIYAATPDQIRTVLEGKEP